MNNSHDIQRCYVMLTRLQEDSVTICGPVEQSPISFETEEKVSLTRTAQPLQSTELLQTTKSSKNTNSLETTMSLPSINTSLNTGTLQNMNTIHWSASQGDLSPATITPPVIIGCCSMNAALDPSTDIFDSIVAADPVAAISTDSVAAFPTDSVAAIPTDSVAAFPTDSVAAIPTDSVAAFPTDSVAAIPTDLVADFSTDSDAAIPTDFSPLVAEANLYGKLLNNILQTTAATRMRSPHPSNEQGTLNLISNDSASKQGTSQTSPPNRMNDFEIKDEVTIIKMVQNGKKKKSNNDLVNLSSESSLRKTSKKKNKQPRLPVVRFIQPSVAPMPVDDECMLCRMSGDVHKPDCLSLQIPNILKEISVEKRIGKKRKRETKAVGVKKKASTTINDVEIINIESSSVIKAKENNSTGKSKKVKHVDANNSINCKQISSKSADSVSTAKNKVKRKKTSCATPVQLKSNDLCNSPVYKRTVDCQEQITKTAVEMKNICREADEKVQKLCISLQNQCEELTKSANFSNLSVCLERITDLRRDVSRHLVRSAITAKELRKIVKDLVVESEDQIERPRQPHKFIGGVPAPVPPKKKKKRLDAAPLAPPTAAFRKHCEVREDSTAEKNALSCPVAIENSFQAQTNRAASSQYEPKHEIERNTQHRDAVDDINFIVVKEEFPLVEDEPCE